METLEQRCSLLAWDKLVHRFTNATEEWKDNPDAKEYLGALKKTPARIHNSGLGQALAFLRSRPEQAAACVEGDLAELALALLGVHGNNLLSLVRNNDNTFLFLATDEVMRVIGWLARYLEGAGVKSKHAEGDEEGDDAS